MHFILKISNHEDDWKQVDASMITCQKNVQKGFEYYKMMSCKTCVSNSIICLDAFAENNHHVSHIRRRCHTHWPFEEMKVSLTSLALRKSNLEMRQLTQTLSDFLCFYHALSVMLNSPIRLFISILFSLLS